MRTSKKPPRTKATRHLKRMTLGQREIEQEFEKMRDILRPWNEAAGHADRVGDNRIGFMPLALRARQSVTLYLLSKMVSKSKTEPE